MNKNELVKTAAGVAAKHSAYKRRSATAPRASASQAASPLATPPTRLLLKNARDGEIHSVRFHYFDLQAGEVMLAGTFNNWQPQPMNKQSADEWFLDLLLAPGRYEYRLIVDGDWKDDPMAPAYIGNAFGTLNSVLEVKQFPSVSMATRSVGQARVVR